MVRGQLSVKTIRQLFEIIIGQRTDNNNKKKINTVHKVINNPELTKRVLIQTGAQQSGLYYKKSHNTTQ